MAKILVLGAGRQGTAAAFDLLRDGHTITLLDRDSDIINQAIERLEFSGSDIGVVDLNDPDSLIPWFERADAAVFAADYSLNVDLTRLAIANHCHTIDFGGNHDIVHEQHELDDDAKAAGVAIMPDCGLTPGLAGILVAGGLKTVGGRAKRAAIRVGGLPLEPKPPLNYALVFSVRGLTNEYIEPSVVMENGHVTTRQSMTGLESLSLFGRDFEAFYTSGGVSTLPESFGDKIDNLDCKTIRYPGHADKFQFLFGLGFGSSKPMEGPSGKFIPREALETLLVEALPHDPPDEVVMRVTVQGDAATAVYEMRDVFDEVSGLTAMQRTTAWPGTRILAMILGGTIQERGVLYQERVVDVDELIRQLGKRGIMISKT